MTIRSSLEPKHAFTPEMIATMAKAVRETCILLNIDADDVERRENVVHVVIMLTEMDGEANSQDLRERAVEILNAPATAIPNPA